MSHRLMWASVVFSVWGTGHVPVSETGPPPVSPERMIVWRIHLPLIRSRFASIADVIRLTADARSTMPWWTSKPLISARNGASLGKTSWIEPWSSYRKFAYVDRVLSAKAKLTFFQA
jgi:hypothetical protein